MPLKNIDMHVDAFDSVVCCVWALAFKRGRVQSTRTIDTNKRRGLIDTDWSTRIDPDRRWQCWCCCCCWSIHYCCCCCWCEKDRSGMLLHAADPELNYVVDLDRRLRCCCFAAAASAAAISVYWSNSSVPLLVMLMVLLLLLPINLLLLLLLLSIRNYEDRSRSNWSTIRIIPLLLLSAKQKEYEFRPS